MESSLHADGLAANDSALQYRLPLPHAHVVRIKQVQQQPSTDAMMDVNDPDTPTTTPQSHWNREEHNRFMQALETYGTEQSGDEWKKITAFVQTRSLEEVRLHGKRYLQQLMRQLPRTHRLIPSPPIRLQSNNQNDPNGPNHSSATAQPTQKAARPRAKSKSSKSKQTPPPSTLSANAMAAAQAMSISPSVPSLQKGYSTTTITTSPQPSAGPMATEPVPTKAPVLPSSKPSASISKKGTRRPKVWTFDEDKVFETALASWNSDKPYSWPKIATQLPGKTAKDVRSRYEKLVSDIAAIENQGPLPVATEGKWSRNSGFWSDGLSSCLRVGNRTSGYKLPTTGVSMLSPTFLDFLSATSSTKDATSELPSPPHPTKLPTVTTSFEFKSTPKGLTTPRLWQEFLEDDFKFARE